jgi:tetratricopeptide (TPR) repeat protein
MKAMRSERVHLLKLLAPGLLVALTGAAAPASAPQEEIPITTSSPEARAQFVKAREFVAYGHFPEARKALDEAVAKDPNFVLAQIYKAMLETDTAKGFETLDKARALIAKTQVSDGERLWLEYQQFASKAQQSRRLETVEKMVKAYPKDRWAMLENGWLQTFLQQNEKAVEVLTRLTQLAPDFGAAWATLAAAQQNLENYAEAEKAFKKQAELLPNEPAAWDAQGWLLMKEGKFDEAGAAFDKAISLDAKLCSPVLGQGLDQALKGKGAEGRKTFAKALEIAQDDWCRNSAQYGMSISYLLENKVDPAVQELQKAVAMWEKNKDFAAMGDTVAESGFVLSLSSRTKDAVAHYAKAGAHYDKSALPAETKALYKSLWLVHHQAIHFLQAGDLKMAKQKAADFKQTADKNSTPPRQLATHQLAGLIAVKEKRWDDAIAEPQKANPRNCTVMVGLGDAYLAKGDKDKARQLWTRAANFNELDLEFAAMRSVAQQKLAALK